MVDAARRTIPGLAGAPARRRSTTSGARSSGSTTILELLRMFPDGARSAPDERDPVPVRPLRRGRSRAVDAGREAPPARPAGGDRGLSLAGRGRPERRAGRRRDQAGAPSEARGSLAVLLRSPAEMISRYVRHPARARAYGPSRTERPPSPTHVDPAVSSCRDPCSGRRRGDRRPRRSSLDFAVFGPRRVSMRSAASRGAAAGSYGLGFTAVVRPTGSEAATEYEPRDPGRAKPVARQPASSSTPDLRRARDRRRRATRLLRLGIVDRACARAAAIAAGAALLDAAHVRSTSRRVPAPRRP